MSHQSGPAPIAFRNASLAAIVSAEIAAGLNTAGSSGLLFAAVASLIGFVSFSRRAAGVYHRAPVSAPRRAVRDRSACPAGRARIPPRDRLTPMREEHPTRREILLGMAAVPLLESVLEAQIPAPASSICFTSTVEMARLIRAKKLSAREALAAHLKQIELVNPRVNAIVTLVPEMAAASAAKADEMQAHGETLGPLHGLPAAHKDLVETRGIRTTFGSLLYKDYIPAEDDLIVERLHRAGVVTIGKTNTPEFGAGSQTFNKVFGATHNPYDLTKTCGGSSGGAAVALACGMVPVADGSDTGGSLRNPAAFCNIAGFRPSIGRVPNPRAALPWFRLSTSGCLGRSVADLALVLSTIAGPDSRAPLSINEPGEVFARPLGRSFKGIRVAWFKDLGGVPFDPRVRSVVDGQTKTFESLGCIVE